MQKMLLKINKKLLLIMKIVMLTGILFQIADQVYAKDLLDGTTTDVLDTMKGKARNWAFIIDFAISVAAFAVTKKPFVFFSVLAMALAFTVVTKLAGG